MVYRNTRKNHLFFAQKKLVDPYLSITKFCMYNIHIPNLLLRKLDYMISEF